MPLPRELSSVTEQEKQHIVLQRMEREEEKKLSNLSLQTAMRGMEDEKFFYSEEDLTEHFG